MRRRTGRWLALGVAVVLAGASTGAVLASRLDDGSDLAASIDEAPLTQVAEIAAADGAPGLGVFVQSTSTGHVCVWEAPSATSRERGGGCNTADDPLNGHSLTFTLSYDGGPALSRVKSATLFGLAGGEVARATILMTDGSRREIRLRDVEVGGEGFRAFGYRFKRADLRQGIAPMAVVAIGPDGVEVDRQATGIG